jgi:hypothetical protein
MTDRANVVVLQSDMTERWSCRQGDFVLWVRSDNPFALAFSIGDVWELRDGDYVTITNRIPDLPPWFELQPSEASNAAAYEMIKKLENGFEPNGTVDGPNLWRACAGDRLVWVGPSRPPTHGEDLQRIIDFREDCLVFAESSRPDFTPLDLMAITEGVHSPEAQNRCRSGYDAACALGIPTTMIIDRSEWSLG